MKLTTLPSSLITHVVGQASLPSDKNRIVWCFIAGEQVHALIDTGAATSFMAVTNKYPMFLKLGFLSLHWPSGLVCELGGTPLPVIGETKVKLMDADALPVLVTKDFPHELLLYTDFIPHTASV